MLVFVSGWLPFSPADVWCSWNPSQEFINVLFNNRNIGHSDVDKLISQNWKSSHTLNIWLNFCYMLLTKGLQKLNWYVDYKYRLLSNHRWFSLGSVSIFFPVSIARIIRKGRQKSSTAIYQKLPWTLDDPFSSFDSCIAVSTSMCNFPYRRCTAIITPIGRGLKAVLKTFVESEVTAWNYTYNNLTVGIIKKLILCYCVEFGLYPQSVKVNLWLETEKYVRVV